MQCQHLLFRHTCTPKLAFHDPRNVLFQKWETDEHVDLMRFAANFRFG